MEDDVVTVGVEDTGRVAESAAGVAGAELSTRVRPLTGAAETAADDVALEVTLTPAASGAFWDDCGCGCDGVGGAGFAASCA